jgi:hypothetical protein
VDGAHLSQVEHFANDVLPGGLSWRFILPPRTQEAFAALMPRDRAAFARLARDPEFRRVARHLLTEGLVLEYLPESVLNQLSGLFEGQALQRPADLLAGLVAVQDDDGAFQRLGGLLEQALELSRQGTRFHLTLPEEILTAGRSALGRPIARDSRRARLGLGYIRMILPDGRVEDWSDMAHIDFERYAQFPRVEMIQSVRRGPLTYFAHRQEVTTISRLPTRIQGRVRSLYAASRPAGGIRETGLWVVEWSDGTYSSRLVHSPEPDRIATDAVEQGLMQALGRSAEWSSRRPVRASFFHTHPEQPGKVSTTLSHQDVEVGVAVDQWLGARGMSIPVDVYALPLSGEADGIAFLSRSPR